MRTSLKNIVLPKLYAIRSQTYNSRISCILRNDNILFATARDVVEYRRGRISLCSDTAPFFYRSCLRLIRGQRNRI